MFLRHWHRQVGGFVRSHPKGVVGSRIVAATLESSVASSVAV